MPLGFSVRAIKVKKYVFNPKFGTLFLTQSIFTFVLGHRNEVASTKNGKIQDTLFTVINHTFKDVFSSFPKFFIAFFAQKPSRQFFVNLEHYPCSEMLMKL